MRASVRLGLLTVALAAIAVPAGPAGAASLPRVPDAYPFELGGDVHAMARAGDTLYLGGDFTYLGPRVERLARLDGSGAPEAGFPQVRDGAVRVVTPDGAGGWYVAGSFTQIGGVERVGLARVLADGSVATGFDAGLSGYVDLRALALHDGALYVAGTIPPVAGGTRTGVAALDAATGALRSFDAQLNSEANALEVHDGRLYVGGTFTSAAGEPRDGLAAFSLATGQRTAFAPDLDNGGAAPAVSALDAGGGRLYVTGSFLRAGGADHERIAALDPVTGAPDAWAPRLDQAMPYVAYAADTQTVFAGGAHAWLNRGGPGERFSALHAIGTDAAGAPGVPWVGGCTSMTLVGPVLYLACTFFDAGRYPVMVRGYDVRTWTEVFSARLRGSPSTGDTEVRAIGAAGGEVVAGGFYTTIGGRTQDRLAAVDIATGEALPFNPGADGTVRALTVVDGDLVAGGDFTTVGGATRRGVARLDPGTGAPRAWDPNVTGGPVRALARDGSTLYLGGDFTAVGGETRTYAAAVALSTGAPLAFAPQITGTRVNAVAVDDAGVVLGGRFTAIGGQPRAALAAVDGAGALRAGWNASITAAGAVPEVFALARDGDNVLAGGVFASAGVAARRHVASLALADGSATSWDAALTEGLGVYALELRGDEVLLGGARTPPNWDGDTAIFGRHRRSDGRAIEDLVDVDSTIRALHSAGASIFVGGTLTWVGYRQRDRRGFTSFSLPPESTRSPAITGTPGDGQTLTCATGAWANAPARYAYAWRRDGAAIGGATVSTYVVGPADAGRALTCAVTASNRGGAATAVSAPAGGVAPPSADAPPQVTGTPAYGAPLVCARGTWSGDIAGYAVRWLRDGDPIDGATEETYTPGNEDASRDVSCRVTVSGAGGHAAETAAPVRLPDRPVLSTPPSVAGTAEPGQTLSCAPGGWASATPVTYTYAWTADGAEVGTGATYGVREDDRARTLRCDVRATNAGGWVAAHAGSALVPGLPPVSLVAPTITGAPRAGEVVRCAPGSWQGAFDVREYTWEVDGEVVMGPTADSLTLTPGHRGRTIRCSETARSWQWGATARTSPAVLVGWDPPRADERPVVVGAARPGELLTCRPGTWTDADRLQVAWRRDGRPDEEAATRRLTDQDAGTVLTCRVTATGRGGVSIRDSEPVTVAVAEPRAPGPEPAPTRSERPPAGTDPPASPQRLTGGRGRDVLRGRESDDVLDGGGGDDRLLGGPGRDRLTGGPGRDLLDGGAGDDVLDARDGRGGDRLVCGAGRDRAVADRGDRVARDCERVVRR